MIAITAAALAFAGPAMRVRRTPPPLSSRSRRRPPLPPPPAARQVELRWRAVTAADGRVYFWHTQTGAVTWDQAQAV